MCKRFYLAKLPFAHLLAGGGSGDNSPVSERGDNEAGGVAQVLEPVLQLRVDHPQVHRLVLQVVPAHRLQHAVCVLEETDCAVLDQYCT